MFFARVVHHETSVAEVDQIFFCVHALEIAEDGAQILVAADEVELLAVRRAGEFYASLREVDMLQTVPARGELIAVELRFAQADRAQVAQRGVIEPNRGTA